MKLPEHILITNDDGIDAPGIRLLQQVIEAAGAKPVLVAPMDAQSGCSHHINLYSPFKVDFKQNKMEWALAR